MNGIRMRGVAALVSLHLLATSAAAADSVVASRAWARATPPGMDVAAVYLTLQGGKTADRLLGATSPRAAMVHLHKVEQQGGVAQMRPVDGLELPAHATVTLAPQTMHLMLMGVAGPLVAGQHFPVTLQFARSGPLTVDVEVRAATAPDDSMPPALH